MVLNFTKTYCMWHHLFYFARGFKAWEKSGKWGCNPVCIYVLNFNTLSRPIKFKCSKAKHMHMCLKVLWSNKSNLLPMSSLISSEAFDIIQENWTRKWIFEAFFSICYFKKKNCLSKKTNLFSCFFSFSFFLIILTRFLFFNPIFSICLTVAQSCQIYLAEEQTFGEVRLS